MPFQGHPVKTNTSLKSSQQKDIGVHKDTKDDFEKKCGDKIDG